MTTIKIILPTSEKRCQRAFVDAPDATFLVQLFGAVDHSVILLRSTALLNLKKALDALTRSHDGCCEDAGEGTGQEELCVCQRLVSFLQQLLANSEAEETDGEDGSNTSDWR